jgi:hypothetical protein
MKKLPPGDERRTYLTLLGHRLRLDPDGWRRTGRVPVTGYETEDGRQVPDHDRQFPRLRRPPVD